MLFYVNTYSRTTTAKVDWVKEKESVLLLKGIGFITGSVLSVIWDLAFVTHPSSTSALSPVN